MVAKSIDVVIFLKMLVGGEGKTYAELSAELGISASEIHAGVKRGVIAGLVEEGTRRPLRRPLEEYLIHGVRYAFPAERGPIARGVPTAYAAAPLSEKISGEEFPPVWADPAGEIKGYAVEPLYHSAPMAARRDAKLYEMLALVDAMRVGRARERKLAEVELKKRLAYVDAA